MARFLHKRKSLKQRRYARVVQATREIQAESDRRFLLACMELPDFSLKSAVHYLDGLDKRKEE